jgi:hypothetical protein
MWYLSEIIALLPKVYILMWYLLAKYV